MDAKFERRFKSFCNSLDALAEARQRDLSDSFVLSGSLLHIINLHVNVLYLAYLNQYLVFLK